MTGVENAERCLVGINAQRKGRRGVTLLLLCCIMSRKGVELKMKGQTDVIYCLLVKQIATELT